MNSVARRQLRQNLNKCRIKESMGLRSNVGVDPKNFMSHNRIDTTLNEVHPNKGIVEKIGDAVTSLFGGNKTVEKMTFPSPARITRSPIERMEAEPLVNHFPEIEAKLENNPRELNNFRTIMRASNDYGVRWGITKCGITKRHPMEGPINDNGDCLTPTSGPIDKLMDDMRFSPCFEKMYPMKECFSFSKVSKNYNKDERNAIEYEIYEYERTKCPAHKSRVIERLKKMVKPEHWAAVGLVNGEKFSGGGMRWFG